jgi:sucrose-6-phosphatase
MSDRQFLLVTDLDNTLVGDDLAMLALHQKLRAVRHQIYLIYATGRSYSSARRLQDRKQLLEPDYWITGVGTEIYQQADRDLVWAEQLSQNWDRDAVVEIAAAFPDLTPQTEQEQNPWKVSYLLYSAMADAIVQDLRSKLAQAGLEAQVIYSSSEDVDILPRLGNKGLAMTYLRKRLQIPAEKTLVCGDSGNDISLFQQNTPGVLVGNARSELLEWYQQQGQLHHYLAEAMYAGGILEALDHLGWV